MRDAAHVSCIALPQFAARRRPRRVGRITPLGVVTEFSAGITGLGPSGITRGPDGNPWFTEYNENQIGRTHHPESSRNSNACEHQIAAYTLGNSIVYNVTLTSVDMIEFE
jgi:hypothetical protein